MKQSLFLTAFLALLAFSVAAQTEKPAELKTVGSLDLKRYSGKWFEIARYPNKFQEKCAGKTTATYTLKTDGKVEVLNQCVKKDGTLESARGEARIKDKAANAKLEVRFAPKIVSFLPNVWANYWVIELDQNYEYAVVGDPKRKYLWVLSRKPEMSDALYQGLLRKAEAHGFNPGKLQKTPQNMELLKGGVIEN